MTMTETDLVLAARRGDRRAAEALLEGRRRWVFVRCLRATGDPHAAEDVTQEVLVRAFERLSQLRRPAAFGAWLGRILARCCAERLEQTPVAQEPAVPPGGPDLLSELPLELAEPVRLFYQAGLNLAETAARLGLTATTIKSRLQIARRRLREEYRPMQTHRVLAEKRRAWLTAALADGDDERLRRALDTTASPPLAVGRVPASNVLLVDGPGALDRHGGGLEELRDELRYRGLTARASRRAERLVPRLKRDRIDILVLGDGVEGNLWEHLRAIRLDRATRSVTVVLLVNGAEYRQEVAYRGWLAGVDCFLTKPVDRLEAADFVARLDGQVRARDLQLLAVDHAFNEEWDDALACLAEAVERGFDHVRQWARDTAAFRPLHERAEYQALAGS
ncbi:MAG: sigma-70 family RNA polymerase sigma factor [Armatimonadetes bacterium]|nr:sigma-70 family RNA polymerase sigma factor [Armatimonadota bacterium]